MDTYQKPSFFYKSHNKKRILIIIGIAAIVLSICGIVVAMSFSKKNKTSQNSDKQTEKKYDTTIIGDAEDDPENIEIREEEGQELVANELEKERGKSNGIDVSKWQGKIDWKKVKDDGIEFAFIRIGYRGENGTIYKDENADYNIQQAQEAGVLVGVYFFSTAINETEAKEEAGWTVAAIKGYSISYPVVYDCEGYRDSMNRMFRLTAEERTKNAVAFMKTVEDAGYDAMFYGARGDIKDGTYWDMEQIGKHYKVWVAQYSDVVYPTKEKPDYKGKCDAWQYTNKGRVNGINGNVDLVVCYFTKKEAKPKDTSVIIETAKAPLTDEEKLYTAVNENVTAKEVTNLRSAATTKSDVVAVLHHGDMAVRIGVGKNGWSKLQYNGTIVYAITSYLTTDMEEKNPTSVQKDIVVGHTFEPKSDRVTAKEYVNLRKLPTTDSESVGILYSGTFLDRTAISDKGWSRLLYNGEVVYAVSSYLSNTVVEKPKEETPSSSDGFRSVDEQVTAKEETNLRSAPTTEGSEIIYKLKNGEYVKRIGIHSNGWSKLEYNGTIVYAITSYLIP